ncbi:hypothetical protein Poly51_40670 [Rubripirellula tenax]|uniref:Uncharacterized protein n=1 Tax=Rubripirellula tenax TaxID=2528015 RepID=A0A5C6EQW5_9BACT|nr:hypothetical protein Poly51_40670 [Rubripirellula tenax]
MHGDARRIAPIERTQGTSVKFRDGPAAVTDVDELFDLNSWPTTPSFCLPLGDSKEPPPEKAEMGGNVRSQKTYRVIGHEVTFLGEVRVES